LLRRKTVPRFDQEKSEQVSQLILGQTFKFGGRGEQRETDCYGVIVFFYKEFGIKMPDYSCEEDWGKNEGAYLREYAQAFRKLNPDELPECGDMVVFKNVEGACNHAGIFLGDNRFIHALRKVGTKIDRLYDKPWKEKFYGFFRVKINDHS
jgi:cell wall-associated NlpC family hydrolase